MFWQKLRQRLLPQSATGCRTHPAPQRRARLMVEALEDRAVPASFTAATVAELIGAIDSANLSAEADTITLAPDKTFTLKEVNTGNGLPVIAASGDALTVIGNGDTIERSTGRKTPAFRLFEAQAGASLTLQNLTLQGGSDPIGGAVLNLGTLTMIGVTVQKNTAHVGGGIYSNGSLFLQDCVIQDNQAVGADGEDGYRYRIPEDPFHPHGG